MPSRYIRDTVILNKIETVYATDAIPTGAANAVAVSNVRITPLNAQYVSRDLIRAWFGDAGDLVSSYNKLVSFDVECVGSGAAGTAPAWGAILRACGFAETLTAAERASYSPITNSQESSSIYVYDSGVLHKLLGCKGSVSFSMPLGGIPKMSFSMVGIDGGDTAATAAGVTYALSQAPQVVVDQFTGDLTLGGVLSATGVPAMTGGTTYPSAGLDVDMGIKAEYIPLLGSQAVEITDRKAKGKIKIDATAAKEIALYATVLAGTTQTLALLHGTVVGKRFGLYLPAAQLTNPQKDEISGKRMMSYDVPATTSAGNDEVKVITSF
jgi:hypothetical protein